MLRDSEMAGIQVQDVANTLRAGVRILDLMAIGLSARGTALDSVDANAVMWALYGISDRLRNDIKRLERRRRPSPTHGQKPVTLRLVEG